MGSSVDQKGTLFCMDFLLEKVHEESLPYEELSATKKRKPYFLPREVKTFPIHILHPDKHWVDDVSLKSVHVESTPMTIFEKRIFRKPKVLQDIYHHIGGKLGRTRIQVGIKEHGLTQRYMASNHMLEVLLLAYLDLFSHLYNTFFVGCVPNKGGKNFQWILSCIYTRG